jgi:hypothetical protein
MKMNSRPNLPEHVFFVGGNGDVHKISFNGAAWTDLNLTASAGGTGATTNTCRILPLTSLDDTNGEQVYYVGSNGHILRLLSANGTNWESADLTAASGAPNDFAGSCLIE